MPIRGIIQVHWWGSGGWGVRVRVFEEDSVTHTSDQWEAGQEGGCMCCHRDGRTVVLDTVTRQARLPLYEGMWGWMLWRVNKIWAEQEGSGLCVSHVTPLIIFLRSDKAK